MSQPVESDVRALGRPRAPPSRLPGTVSGAPPAPERSRRAHARRLRRLGAWDGLREPASGRPHEEPASGRRHEVDEPRRSAPQVGAARGL